MGLLEEVIDTGFFIGDFIATGKVHLKLVLGDKAMGFRDFCHICGIVTPGHEIPFDIPETWKWVRLGTVVDMLSGFAFKSADFRNDGRYRLLRGINLGVGNIRWDDTVFVDEIPEKLKIYQILKDDVLVGLDRPWISGGIRVTIYDESKETYLVQRVLRIRKGKDDYRGGKTSHRSSCSPGAAAHHQ